MRAWEERFANPQASEDLLAAIEKSQEIFEGNLACIRKEGE